MPCVLQKGLYQDLCLSVQPGSSKYYFPARLFRYVALLFFSDYAKLAKNVVMGVKIYLQRVLRTQIDTLQKNHGTQTTDSIERAKTRATELYFVSKSKDDSMTVTKKTFQTVSRFIKSSFSNLSKLLLRKKLFYVKKIYFLISFNER